MGKVRFIKFTNILLIIMIVLSLSSCQKQERRDMQTNSLNKNRKIVAVSIVPQKTFIKAVAGDTIDVVTMIPPGHSPANYEPTPEQMMKLSEAEVFFSIGVPTEKANILNKAKDLNEELKIVSLYDSVEDIYPSLKLGEEEGKDLQDPHIWLSPKRVKVMINVIKNSLCEIYPENAILYENNAKIYIEQLDEADKKIRNILNDLNQKTFVIYHPSLGYFADEYGLKMIAIEEEGKEATLKRLNDVVDYMKKEAIKVILYQEEFDSQQAKTIAEEVDGVTMEINPLAADYIENLIRLANVFLE